MKTLGSWPSRYSAKRPCNLLIKKHFFEYAETTDALNSKGLRRAAGLIDHGQLKQPMP